MCRGRRLDLPNVKESSPTIHLPLVFKKRRIKSEASWVLVPDEQRIEAVKCFSGGLCHREPKIHGGLRIGEKKRKKQDLYYHSKHTAYAIQLQDMAFFGIKKGWYFI